MRRQHLVAKQRRRVKTTDRRHGRPIAPNRLNRDFRPQRANEKWVADFTSIASAEGWRYLALVLAGFSRRSVGRVMDTHLATALVEQALRMALAQRQPTLGELLHPSDRGGQDASLT
jgi:putative transposase